MNQQQNNPFLATSLVYPIDQREDYVRFSQTENPSSSDEAPFPRRVDMWFAAVAYAVRSRLTPQDLRSRSTQSFVEGYIFDPWRVRALMLLALSASPIDRGCGGPNSYDEHSQRPCSCRTTPFG